jgi:hypothetical protein
MVCVTLKKKFDFSSNFIGARKLAGQISNETLLKFLTDLNFIIKSAGHPCNN